MEMSEVTVTLCRVAHILWDYSQVKISSFMMLKLLVSVVCRLLKMSSWIAEAVVLVWCLSWYFCACDLAAKTVLWVVYSLFSTFMVVSIIKPVSPSSSLSWLLACKLRRGALEAGLECSSKGGGENKTRSFKFSVGSLFSLTDCHLNKNQCLAAVVVALNCKHCNTPNQQPIIYSLAFYSVNHQIFSSTLGKKTFVQNN